MEQIKNLEDLRALPVHTVLRDPVGTLMDVHRTVWTTKAEWQEDSDV